MSYWYYVKDGQPNGPVNEEDLRRQLASGMLGADTLVWMKDLKDWTAARHIENLVPPDLCPPPIPVQPPPNPLHAVTASDVPADILRNIRNAWVAGVISGCITLIITLLAIAGRSLYGFSGTELVDVVLILGLSFGIYKRSRTCAVLMLEYFIFAKVYMMVGGHLNVMGAFVAVIFLYFYSMGIVGAFQYHRFLRSRLAEPGTL